MKVPSHIKTSDVFNVKHLALFMGNSFDEDVNLRANSLQQSEDDVDWAAFDLMKKSGEDACGRQDEV